MDPDPEDAGRGERMRVAISTDGNMVAAHFGRCEAYTLADIEEAKVVKSEIIANPGHEPGFLPGYLAERGVECIVAGGMGPRAHGLFAEQGIQTIVGVSGKVTDALEALARGELESGESTCDH
jgi:predicted Fe-Mo cluster-binding NifX family protein